MEGGEAEQTDPVGSSAGQTEAPPAEEEPVAEQVVSDQGTIKSTQSAAAAGTEAEVVKSAASKEVPEKKKKTSSRKRRGGLELDHAKIGFIGAGKMTEAIVDGLINYAKIAANKICVAAPTTKNLEKFKSLGCKVTKRSLEIFSRFDCDIVFLCFHGSVIKAVYDRDRPRAFTTNFIPNMKHHLYILSLVSGVKLDQIKHTLLNPEHPEKYALEIHRIMINAACAYGLGLCAIDAEPDSSHVSNTVRNLLSSIAKLEYVPEDQMDAACAIGGNGLAFAYYFINAMADGAFKVGLNREMSLKFAAKTVHCGSQCLLESGKHPDELRDEVSAPSGAAIYGIHVLEKADVASGIVAAVEAAHQRAKQLLEVTSS